MSEIMTIEIQDKNANIYYPHTDSSVVKYEDSNIKDTITNINSQLKDLANENLLINGDFQIWQRGTEFNVVKLTNTYTADRWVVQTSENSKVIKNDNGISIQNIDNANGSLSQQIEANKSWIGKKFTLSMIVNNKSIIASGILSSSDYVQSGDGGYPNLYFKYNESNDTISCGYAFTGNINVESAKFEMGEKVTPFVPKLYGEELALCQRYYEVIEYSERLVCDLQRGYSYEFTVPFKVEKRTYPTQKVTNITNDNTDISNIVNAFSAGTGSFGAYINGDSNPNTFKIGSRFKIQGTADAEIY